MRTPWQRHFSAVDRSRSTWFNEPVLLAPLSFVTPSATNQPDINDFPHMIPAMTVHEAGIQYCAHTSIKHKTCQRLCVLHHVLIRSASLVAFGSVAVSMLWHAYGFKCPAVPVSTVPGPHCKLPRLGGCGGQEHCDLQRWQGAVARAISPGRSQRKFWTHMHEQITCSNMHACTHVSTIIVGVICPMQ
jgi:hypothetical protein